MKLLALALGLVLEHFASELLHLRELRWFDRYFDFGLSLLRRTRGVATYAGVIAMLAVLAAPVLVASLVLVGPGALWDPDYLAFAVLVVLLSLGPRDLGTEVEEYCRAIDAGDGAGAERVLVEMTESREVRADLRTIVEEAIFVQAVNRIFGVVFWFVVLGPVGAWLFRISDLLRRRAAFESGRDPVLGEAALPAIQALHGTLKWLPARLVILGYALSGSFDDAANAWRGHRRDAGAALDRNNDELTARVGRAAMTGFLDQPPNSSAAAHNAMRLVKRTLFIWVTTVALMTIFGWAM